MGRLLQALLAVGTLTLASSPCWAQTSIPSTAQAAQSQTLQNSATGTQIPLLPAQGFVAGPAQEPGPTPSVGSAKSSGKLVPSAGRGLPGMSGGPPLFGSMGAGDPSAGYMRPPVLGRLECDLLLDPSCL